MRNKISLFKKTVKFLKKLFKYTSDNILPKLKNYLKRQFSKEQKCIIFKNENLK